MNNIIASLFLITSLFAQYEIGHYNTIFQDPDRFNRNIETEIYYPAISTGDNTSAVDGQFPVIIFGHGFLQNWDVYENLWEEFVPNGYIMVFPTTESSFSNDHPANSTYIGDGYWYCDNGYKKTGNQCEKIYVPPKKKISFKMSKHLKDEINKK